MSFYTSIIFYINKILLFLFVFFIIKNIIKPYVLMVALQFGSAGMYIISMATLNHGMSRFVLIVYHNAVAALTMAPFALLLERLIIYCSYMHAYKLTIYIYIYIYIS